MKLEELEGSSEILQIKIEDVNSFGLEEEQSDQLNDVFVKVEVKTEHDIDVHLDRAEPNDSEASFFESHPYEGGVIESPKETAPTCMNGSDTRSQHSPTETSKRTFYKQDKPNHEVFAENNFHKVHKGKRAEHSCKCKTCGKSFNQSSDLKIHMLIHNGDHPYKCKMSNRTKERAANSPAMPTREKTACDIFGAPSKLPLNVLPTYNDVMKYYLKVKQDLKCMQNNKDPSLNDIIDIVCRDVESSWNKASLPTVLHKRTKQILKAYYLKYRSIMKSYGERKEQESVKTKVDIFLNDSHRLFDICTCKCDGTCLCERARKVPVNEKLFLEDQCTCRKMMIGGTDVIETKHLQKQNKRKEAAILSKRKRKQLNTQQLDQTEASDSEYSHSETDDKDDIPYIFPNTPTPAKKMKIDQMRIKIPSLAEVCDHYGVSDRAAAAASLTTARLKDINVISSEDTTNVIDKSKLRRERNKSPDLAKEGAESNIFGLYFDRRKDKTLTNRREEDMKHHLDSPQEEHICIISEPGSMYYDHVTPDGGSSQSIKDAIVECLKRRNADLNKLDVIGCDGTAVNTGKSRGVIRLIEEYINRPLQWFVCLLHANELPLRHLFQKLDGSTTGRTSFSGPIGKALQTCTTLPVKTFKAIHEELPEIDPKDLSKDQKYLYEMCQAVSKGECPIDLSLRKPGILNHSRWLTTANRLLRLYVSTEKPSRNLVHLAMFIMRVYAPMWFAIKSKPSCKDGARHVFNIIQKSRYMSPAHKKIIDPVIQRNAYFAHTENLLLCMVRDERAPIRELALRRILKARKEKDETDCSVRQFVVPKLNVDAKDYTEIVEWMSCKVTEPPILRNMTNDELWALINETEIPSVDFQRYPCHIQAVERGIKLVTEASKLVCGESSRDGLIRNRQNSRNKMAKFNTKKEYKM